MRNASDYIVEFKLQTQHTLKGEGLKVFIESLGDCASKNILGESSILGNWVHNGFFNKSSPRIMKIVCNIQLL